MPARNGKHQGSHWIRPEKRLAIYIRDGLACVYCEATAEDSTPLTLDHVIPFSTYKRDNLPVSNDPTNLVTACKRCNSARGDRPFEFFLRLTALYLGTDATNLINYALSQLHKPINLDLAKAIIAERRHSVKESGASPIQNR